MDRQTDKQIKGQYQKSLSKHPNECLPFCLVQGILRMKSSKICDLYGGVMDIPMDGRTEGQMEGWTDPLTELHS